jgi:hypothetical protein
MSDHEEFMALPSAVRQSMERAAGSDGLEALIRENPANMIIVTPDDWIVIRDYMVQLYKAYDALKFRLKGLE